VLRRSFVALGVFGALALVPSSAGAASVFGADMTHSPDGSSSFYSAVNVIRPDGSPDSGAPVSGILTSVRIRSAGDAGMGVIRVLTEVAHPNATTYTFNNSPPETPVSLAADTTASGHVTEVLTRRPIATGQRLGWQTTSAAPAGVQQDYLAPSGECAFSDLNHAPGTDLTYTTMLCNHNLLLLSGTIEADSDGDGYGDETQDGCSTNAGTQGPCPTHKKRCKHKKHHKRDAGAAKKKCKKKHR
jgi:hypothetical protein